MWAAEFSGVTDLAVNCVVQVAQTILKVMANVFSRTDGINLSVALGNTRVGGEVAEACQIRLTAPTELQYSLNIHLPT
jgi:hypothetical protein